MKVEEQVFLAVRRARPVVRLGRVEEVRGFTVFSRGPQAALGELCFLRGRSGKVPAEVIGFSGERTVLAPLGPIEELESGAWVEASGDQLRVPVGEGMLGRVVDGLGRPADGLPLWKVEEWRKVEGEPPPPLSRPPIKEPLAVGVRAIDGLLTCGKGQRMGIFAGSGVGKSTLLSMLARGTEARVRVIALIGERSREVRDFLERHLSAEARRRSVTVVATSSELPLVRIRAAFTALAVAEFFRDRGEDVLLVMDSATRLAMAQREVGLSAGEPPTARGYPPSVFTLLPRLVERAGTAPRGSITAFLTVLVEGDDLMDPVADALRAILDGHIVLSRELGEAGHHPGIDVGASVSRLMEAVASPEHRRAAGEFRRLWGVYREARDLIQLGAYRPGVDPVLDRAVELHPAMESFLRQEPSEISSFRETVERLLALGGEKR